MSNPNPIRNDDKIQCAKAMMKNKNYQGAYDLFSSYISENPSDQEVQLFILECNFLLENYTVGIEQALTMAKTCNDCTALDILLHFFCHVCSDFENAITYGAKVLGRVDLEELQNSWPLITIEPWRFYGTLGISYNATNRLDDASRHIKVALSLHKRSSTLYTEWGIINHKIGCDAETLEGFQQAINCPDATPDAYRNLAVLHMRWQQPQQALEVMNSGLEQFPDDEDLATLKSDYSESEFFREFVGQGNSVCCGRIKAVDMRQLREAYESSSSFLNFFKKSTASSESFEELTSIPNNFERYVLAAKFYALNYWRDWAKCLDSKYNFYETLLEVLCGQEEELYFLLALYCCIDLIQPHKAARKKVVNGFEFIDDSTDRLMTNILDINTSNKRRFQLAVSYYLLFPSEPLSKVLNKYVGIEQYLKKCIQTISRPIPEGCKALTFQQASGLCYWHLRFTETKGDSNTNGDTTYKCKYKLMGETDDAGRYKVVSNYFKTEGEIPSFSSGISHNWNNSRNRFCAPRTFVKIVNSLCQFVKPSDKNYKHYETDLSELPSRRASAPRQSTSEFVGWL